MSGYEPIRTADGRVAMLFNDYVVKYDICNFKCDYCLNQLKPDQTDIWKKTVSTGEADEDKEQLCGEPNESLIYSTDTELGKRMDGVVNSYSKGFDAGILRISGGEILAIRNIEKFIEKHSPAFEVVQIVTNGYFLTEDMVKRLKEIGNVHLHFSLDGHNLKLNGNRVKEQKIQDRLLENLENTIKYGLPVEISSILTTANTRNFREYLDYLLRYSGKIVVHPAPVRGLTLQSFFPDKESIESFAIILDEYDKYKSILPPFAYMREMVKFMREGVRKIQCQLPKAALQTLDTGALTPCPNGWTVQLGNLLYDDCCEIADKVGRESIYSLLMHKRPRIDFCKGCYTAYDVVNLYLAGEISDEELARLPLYSGPKVSSRIRMIRDNVKQAAKN